MSSFKLCMLRAASTELSVTASKRPFTSAICDVTLPASTSSRLVSACSALVLRISTCSMLSTKMACISAASLVIIEL
eukprot:COSAG02_NODE_16135_length_1110_cov_1.486647_2_plen_76_part_01